MTSRVTMMHGLKFEKKGISPTAILKRRDLEDKTRIPYGIGNSRVGG
jgi:hypothetical protein